MRFMFVKMINPVTHEPVYMLPEDFKAYAHIPIFRDTVSSVVVVEHIYIGGFPLISKWDDIIRYNGEADIIYESNLIAFHTPDLDEINKELPIENYI